MSDSNNKKILIIGDWVVDEYWIVTTEKSPTSSHIGRQQYRSKIYSSNAQIQTLCASGTIARLLHGLYAKGKNPRVDLYGLGIWDPRDTKFIGALFCNKEIPYQTPHTFMGLYDTEQGKEKQKNLRNSNKNTLCHRKIRWCIECKDPCKRLIPLAKEKDCGTWHVYRVYSQTGSKAPELLYRYDWEIPKENIPLKPLAKVFKSLEDPKFNAVVIVDHDKGAIDEGLIKELLQNKYTSGKDVQWYARCKNPDAPWLKVNGVREKLKLLVVGPMKLELESDPWFLGDRLSAGALKWLCRMGGGEITPKDDKPFSTDMKPKHIVVAHHKNNCTAAIIPKEKGKEVEVLVTTKYPEPCTILVGRTSVLFASLVAHYEGLLKNGTLKSHDKDDNDTIILTKALEHAQQWCYNNEKIFQEDILTSETLNFRRNFDEALIETKSDLFKVGSMDVEKELTEWKQAFNKKNHGVIYNSKETPKKKFEIWRGWSPVKGFIAISKSLRTNIGKLASAVKEFSEEYPPRRSLSILIIGAPGWGKSYLVKALARNLNMRYLEFNITHMTSALDLIACFDTISSWQSQDPTHPLVVFWDEINAPLDNQSTYGYFLDPIWNGTYRRGGQTFQLRPCVWIFAGTRTPNENNKEKSSSSPGSDKGSDFVSRLNGPTIELHGEDVSAGNKGSKKNIKTAPKTRKEDPDKKLEQLYMAVSLIKINYPDVLEISEGVLKYFYKLKPEYGIRSIEFVISRLKNVTHGKLTSTNIPNYKDVKDWLDIKKESSYPKITKKEDRNLVRIFEEPLPLLRDKME